MNDAGKASGEVRKRIAILDPEPVSRLAMQAILNAGTFEVIRVFAAGQDCLDWITRGKVDVVVAEIDLPDYAGVEIVKRLAAQATGTSILVVTNSNLPVDVFGALRAGAAGYLPKSLSADRLLAAVEAVSQGDIVLSGQIAPTVIEIVNPGPPQFPPNVVQSTILSKREKEVLRLIAAGKDNGEIARELCVSPYTIRNHVAHILEKLKLRNRVEAAVHAVRAGVA